MQATRTENSPHLRSLYEDSHDRYSTYVLHRGCCRGTTVEAPTHPPLEVQNLNKPQTEGCSVHFQPYRIKLDTDPVEPVAQTRWSV